MKTLIIIAALSITPLGWTCSTSPGRTITEADGGQTVCCQRGEALTVVISNPAAGGYDIVNAVFDPKILRLVARKELPPAFSPLPRYGDFGKIVFEFQSSAAGETDLVIRIARKWEVKKEPEEHLRVRIRVTE
jgi:predicted secreted protein